MKYSQIQEEKPLRDRISAFAKEALWLSDSTMLIYTDMDDFSDRQRVKKSFAIWVNKTDPEGKKYKTVQKAWSGFVKSKEGKKEGLK